MLRNCKCDDIIISQNLDVSVYAQLLRVLAANQKDFRVRSERLPGCQVVYAL